MRVSLQRLFLQISMETQSYILIQEMVLLSNLYLMCLLTFLMIQQQLQTALLDSLGVRVHQMEAQQFLISMCIMIRDKDQTVLSSWLKV